MGNCMRDAKKDEIEAKTATREWQEGIRGESNNNNKYKNAYNKKTVHKTEKHQRKIPFTQQWIARALAYPVSNNNFLAPMNRFIPTTHIFV